MTGSHPHPKLGNFCINRHPVAYQGREFDNLAVGFRCSVLIERLDIRKNAVLEQVRSARFKGFGNMFGHHPAGNAGMFCQPGAHFVEALDNLIDLFAGGGFVKSKYDGVPDAHPGNYSIRFRSQAEPANCVTSYRWCATMKVMNAVDMLLVIVASSAVAVGTHIGLLRQIGLSAGLLVGCFVAALVQMLLGPFVVKAVGGQSDHFVFWMMLVAALLLVGLFTDFGITFGRMMYKRWHILKDRRGQLISRGGGALLAGLVTLTGLWLLSVMFLRSPVQAIANNVGHSAILSSLSRSLPAAPALFSRASNIFNPHAEPVVFFGNEPAIGMQIPGAKFDAATLAVIAKSRDSAVQVTGQGCGGTIGGSGFVVADNLVMTNAHVVAGLKASQISIWDSKGTHQAIPIYFDPRLDIAILRSAGLAGMPIPIETNDKVQTGLGAALGYSTGSLVMNPVTITGRQSATGYDIYDQNVITREIYAFRGSIESGDSGGPLLNAEGRVVGVVFSKSSDHAGVGYALAASEITKGLVGALSGAQSVDTGRCGSH